jgi:carbon monoxide dehydrogenase subunit G
MQSLTPLRLSELADMSRMRHHILMRYETDASPERVFAILATGENQTFWAPGYVKTEWLTPEHAGVGAVRDIHLDRFIVRERFLVWEPGRRFTFSSDAMKPAVARELVEDIRILPRSDGGSVLEWAVHVSLNRVLALFGPLLIRRVFRPMFESFAGGLAAYATAHR